MAVLAASSTRSVAWPASWFFEVAIPSLWQSFCCVGQYCDCLFIHGKQKILSSTTVFNCTANHVNNVND
jgi:hypothetical protein